MKKCFRCGAEISDEEEYCERCTQIRACIDKHMKESDLQLTMLGIFVLTVAILVSIHAATYMTPRDFIVTVGGNVLLVLVGGWVLAHLPSIHGP